MTTTTRFLFAALLCFTLTASAWALDYPSQVEAFQPALSESRLYCLTQRYWDTDDLEVPDHFYLLNDDTMVFSMGPADPGVRCELRHEPYFNTADTVVFHATMKIIPTLSTQVFTFFQIHNKGQLGFDYVTYRRGVPLMLQWRERHERDGVFYDDYLWVKVRDPPVSPVDRNYEGYPLMERPDGFFDVQVRLEDSVAVVEINDQVLFTYNMEHIHIFPINFFNTGVYMFEGPVTVQYKALHMDVIEIIETRPTPYMPEVTGLSVIEVGSNDEIGELMSSGTVLNLEAHPGLNIRADVDGDVESVCFYLNGGLVSRESKAPYTIAGDSPSNEGIAYHRWEQDVGVYTLTAIAYTENKCQGVASADYTVDIEIIVDNSWIPTVTGFTLIEVGTNAELGPIQNGSSIDLGAGRSVRADTTGRVGSVTFYLDGERTKRENFAPYSIAGEPDGVYNAWEEDPGTYVLSAIAFTDPHGNGIEGAEYSITVTLV